jgi:hypothetical protein
MFETINYILYEKNKTELDPDLLQGFSPFMTSKVFSYYASGEYCNYINDTLNIYSGIFKTKEEEFKFFNNIIPKLKMRRSEYIKKSKNEKIVEDIQHIPEFLSKREIALYAQ